MFKDWFDEHFFNAEEEGNDDDEEATDDGRVQRMTKSLIMFRLGNFTKTATSTPYISQVEDPGQ